MADRGLTAIQQRFVDEYLVDLNAKAAYIRAGYRAQGNAAEACASRLLSLAKVAEAIAIRKAERCGRVEITQDYVLGMLVKNLERAMQAEAVLDREGNPTGEYVYHGSVANKAIELLGKHIGLFPDRHEVTGKDGAQLVIREVVVHEPSTRDSTA